MISLDDNGSLWARSAQLERADLSQPSRTQVYIDHSRPKYTENSYDLFGPGGLRGLPFLG
jgi:hypothetical protein